jgi:hypothetical protein
MTSKIDDATAEVAKEFDTYYRDYFWDEINKEPNAKKMKLAELEPDCVKLDADDAVAIAIASGDYFIFNCVDDVLADDECRTTFVLKIHAMAKTLKAKHGDSFDGKAIATAFRALRWMR